MIEDEKVAQEIPVYGSTDIGRIRQQNEDFLQHSAELKLYVVADGMGGHSAGDVASRVAVESVFASFSESFSNDSQKDDDADEVLVEFLRTAMYEANNAVFDKARLNPDLDGMGTTMVALAAGRERVVLGHVGDSRIYRFCEDSLDRVTQDHSLLNLYVQNQWITKDQARYFPHKHIVLRAMGLNKNIEADLKVLPRVSGTLFLLCSDGLSDLVSDQEIERIVRQHGPKALDTMIEALIEAALVAGGHDNITAMAIVV